MTNRSEYRVEAATPDKLLIRDIGSGPCKSVTNDAENVVDDLRREGLLEGRRLFYFDSMDLLDEITLTHDNRFDGFKSARDMDISDFQ